MNSTVKLNELKTTMTRLSEPHLILKYSAPVYKWVKDLSETLTTSLDSLMRSPESKALTTGAEQVGQAANGTHSLATSKQYPHLPVVGEITAKDLNQMQLSMFGSLSQIQRLEHRALERCMNSLALQSMKDGHKNTEIIRRVDLVLKMLVNMELLPPEGIIGRQKFMDMPYLHRTALATPISYLEEYRDAIKDAIEDHTDYNADETFSVISGGSIIASTQGYFPMASDLGQRMINRVNALPDTNTRSKVLRDKDRLIKLISSD